MRDSTTDRSLLNWLSSPENPAVRYLTAVHLKGLSSPRALKSLREEILRWEPLKQIIALQREDGSFPSLDGGPTAGPTFVALCLADRCGMDVGDAPVAKALAYLWGRHAEKGAFSHNTGGSGILPCYLGLLVRSCIRMGGLDFPGVGASLKWIVDHQRFDHKHTRAGGNRKWPFRAVVNYRCWASVSCYHGVAASFLALAAVPKERRSAEMQARLRGALAYLKIHRVFKKSNEDKPLFRSMTQFFLWGDHRVHLIDVLEGIADADPTLGCMEWVREAIEVVEELAESGKIRLLGNARNLLVHPLAFERIGEPSRFLTYQWLLVKQKFGLLP
jgi:hypothetical protein